MIADFAPEAALAGLLEAMDRAGLGCTVVLERDGVHSRVYANAALAKIYGRDLESTRALSPLGSLPVVEHERVEKLRALGPTVDEPFETVLLRADGTTVPVAVALGFTTLGGAPATVAFVRDVSQQAQIEAALRDSEDRFRLLAEACPDSITMSLGARYSYANPVALRLLGLSSLEELATFDAWSTVPPNLRDQTSERVARLKRGERVPPFVMYLRRQGKDIAVETSLSLAPVAGGLAILSYSRDVTERQRLQAELMKQDRLASVGTLAAGVGHELNNPLGALTLQSRKLLERADAHGFSPEVRASLQQIDEAATRMRTIISDLLFLARPVDRPQSHVDLAQILSSTVALLCAGTPTPLDVKVEAEGLPPIRAYPSKLGQVFLNLLRNAAQAVEGRAGGTVAVRARAIDVAIEITVSDNGPGASSSVLQQMAQPFFTTKTTGTGLGLWISQELVHQHGGTMHLASTEGKGMTVTVRLPLEPPPSSG